MWKQSSYESPNGMEQKKTLPLRSRSGSLKSGWQRIRRHVLPLQFFQSVAP
ncbi:hypothetical protein HNQ39_000221 [Armatimonas rosea]|uniref:Uncharacterized protein n=1 Tax=Armatimonas rosea TaxID=685828 RepID=A0A7W9SLP4_ARMRO|nr:hypothetical protein [Armatimonas rosea]